MRNLRTLIMAIAMIASFVWQAFAATALENARAVLAENYPKVAIDGMEESVIKGLFEVQSGQRIFYFDPVSKSLVFGEIYSLGGKSLTAEKRDALIQRAVSAKLATFPYNKAIKLGNGKKVVIEVTDPDCPYCRSAFTKMQDKKDITKYVVFAPLAHPQAIIKCQYVIDAQNKEKAYADMMSGMPLPKDYKPSKAAIERSEEMLKLAKELGINGTPTFFINGKMVAGADMNKIDKLLQ